MDSHCHCFEIFVGNPLWLLLAAGTNLDFNSCSRPREISQLSLHSRPRPFPSFLLISLVLIVVVLHHLGSGKTALLLQGILSAATSFFLSDAQEVILRLESGLLARP